MLQVFSKSDVLDYNVFCLKQHFQIKISKQKIYNYKWSMKNVREKKEAKYSSLWFYFFSCLRTHDTCNKASWNFNINLSSTLQVYIKLTTKTFWSLLVITKYTKKIKQITYDQFIAMSRPIIRLVLLRYMLACNVGYALQNLHFTWNVIFLKEEALRTTKFIYFFFKSNGANISYTFFLKIRVTKKHNSLYSFMSFIAPLGYFQKRIKYYFRCLKKLVSDFLVY